MLKAAVSSLFMVKVKVRDKVRVLVTGLGIGLRLGLGLQTPNGEELDSIFRQLCNASYDCPTNITVACAYIVAIQRII